MNGVFLFHTAILILIIALILATRRGRGTLPIVGLLLLYLFHCVFWGSGCTSCNLSSWPCRIEAALFWILVVWILYNRFGPRASP